MLRDPSIGAVAADKLAGICANCASENDVKMLVSVIGRRGG